MTFNIGGGTRNTISLKELTLSCQKLIGHKIKFKNISKTSIFDIPYFVTDNRKIKKFYNWKPSKNVNQILKDIIIWFKQNKMVLKYFK